MSRARPEHVARAIRCRECGAPVEVADERTVMQVCQHCGTQLELSGVEQRVLERGSSRPDGIKYRLDLGERLAMRGTTYEVIARVCLIEDHDTEDQTHQYYLYHPSRKPLWLSDYEGQFDLTWRTRVRPKGDVFDGSNSMFTTYDGRTWQRGEAGVADVYHVDGALPYVQRRGDSIAYVELSLKGDFGTLFEATRTDGEVEYGEGVSVSIGEVQRWVGRQLVSSDVHGGSPSRPASIRLGWPEMMVVGITLLLSIGLWMYGAFESSSGRPVLNQVLSPGETSADSPGASFVVPSDENIVRVQLSAPLQNAWMYAQLALVEDDGDTVVHVDETDLSYYFGTTGGESWTEGSQAGQLFVTVEEAGTYRLMLGGTSGYGERTSSSMQHRLHAAVFVDAAYRKAATYGAVAGFVLGVLAFLMAATMQTMLPAARAKPGARVVAGLHAVGSAVILALSLYGCSIGWGAPELEHPQGISIRQSSVPGVAHAPFFMVYNSPRSHLGGGVHAGK